MAPVVAAGRRSALVRAGWRLRDADHRDRCGDALHLAIGSWAFWDRDRLRRDWFVVGLGCGGLRGLECWLGEQPPEASGEVAFEAPQRALVGFPLGLFAGEVFAGCGVVVGAGDRDRVQRPVELPVTAAVEPVLGSVP